MFFIFSSLESFWKHHPALLYALAMLIGVNSALSWNISFLLPIALMSAPLITSTTFLRKIVLSLFLMTGCFLYVSTNYLFPTLDPSGTMGSAVLEISSIASKTTHFGKQWSYRGYIQKFETLEGTVLARNIPYTLSIPKRDDLKRPLADKAYKVSGKLKELMPGYYVLNVDKDTPWYPVGGSWSLAEWRFQIKQTVIKYIREHLSDSRVSTFLAGIATGDFDDRTMFFEFGRFGLQHIMAISGFHFAIIAAILSLFLRVFISKRKATLTLIFLLSSYFLFLGSGSSIMRAWITILIVLCGSLIERRGSGLNSLGLAMIVILMMDPLLSQSIGFQFSFITTAAILMFFAGSDYVLQGIFKKRPLSHVIEMDQANQHGYCILTFMRQAVALTIAVNLIALPMTMYLFHKFPVHSLIYNLFFPFMVSLSMLFLIMGLALSMIIPPLGSAINTLNEKYTQFMLNFIYNMPTSLDVVWKIHNFPQEVLLIYLCAIFLAGVCFKHYLELNHEELQDVIPFC